MRKEHNHRFRKISESPTWVFCAICVPEGRVRRTAGDSTGILKWSLWPSHSHSKNFRENHMPRRQKPIKRTISEILTVRFSHAYCFNKSKINILICTNISFCFAWARSRTILQRQDEPWNQFYTFTPKPPRRHGLASTRHWGQASAGTTRQATRGSQYKKNELWSKDFFSVCKHKRRKSKPKPIISMFSFSRCF